MLSISKTYRKGGALLLFYLTLFIAAAMRDFVLTPYIAHPLGEPYGALVEPVWKAAFWLLPSYLYVRYVLHRDVLQYLKLTTHIRKGILWGILGTIVIFAYFYLPRLVFRGGDAPREPDLR